MLYEVVLTHNAEADINSLHQRISEYDSPAKADALLSKIEDVITSLEHLPTKGSYPPEMISVGIKEYRQILFKPYRMIYSIKPSVVTIHVVTDSRRDLQGLLMVRLLGM
jgi:toxin ParE1/3/4